MLIDSDLVLAVHSVKKWWRGRLWGIITSCSLFHAVFALVLFPTKSHGAERLRGGWRHLSSSTTLCRIVLVDHWSERPDGVVVTNDGAACATIIFGKETDNLFTILDMPEYILDDNASALKAGTLFVSIVNATIVDGEALSLDPDSEIQVIQDPRRSKRTVEDLSEKAMGNKTIAVIRISTLDASPTTDAATLAYRLFSPEEINLKTQYAACSFGKLQWALAPAGVVDVIVNQTASEFSSGSSLVAAAQTVMSNNMNIQVSELADKVMMCLPPGIGPGWIASSGVGHWRAQFNDEWCLSLTAGMHELGHTIGLLHSNEGGQAYGDSTGYMSFGRKDRNFPRKCFNGLHNWQLGWYHDRHMTIKTVSDQESYLIKLATFVDYDLTKADEPVLLKVLDNLVLQYNRAKGMNIGTEQNADQVTITVEGKGGSEMLAGLSVGDQYFIENFRGTARQLIIAACEETKGETGADIMLISVSLDKEVQCPNFNNDEWRTEVAINIHLPNHNNNGPVPVNTVSPDHPAEKSNKAQGVGPDGFWDLFDDRHNQSSPNLDSLVQSANTVQKDASQFQHNETKKRGDAVGDSSSILEDFLDGTISDQGAAHGNSTNPMLSDYFDYMSSRHDFDGLSIDEENTDALVVTSGLLEDLLDQDP